jgi:hypothetical protein
MAAAKEDVKAVIAHYYRSSMLAWAGDDLTKICIREGEGEVWISRLGSFM